MRAARPRRLRPERVLLAALAGASLCLFLATGYLQLFRSRARNARAQRARAASAPPPEPTAAQCDQGAASLPTLHDIGPILPRCDPLPEVTCAPAACRAAKDPRFLRVAARGGNASAGEVEALAGRRYWFMGNSVTRHYMLAWRELLDDGFRATADRQAEKRECRGVLGVASCTVPVLRGGREVTRLSFLWKNYLDPDVMLHDDARRDACATTRGVRGRGTRECLARLFAGATERDVLVVGSVATNLSTFAALNGSSWAPLRLSGPAVAHAARLSNARAHLRALEAAFPGAIVWHSYPHVINSTRSPTMGYEAYINACFGFADARVRCAAEGSARVVFLDLRRAQERHEGTYLDMIHHPGFLSQYFVQALAAWLPA